MTLPAWFAQQEGPIRDLIAYLNGKVIMDPIDYGHIRQLNDLTGLVRILEMVR